MATNNKDVKNDNNLNAKQLQFANLYLETGHIGNSYKTVYDPKNEKSDKACNSSGSRLLKNGKVKSYIDSQQKAINDAVVEKVAMTEADVLMSLSEIAMDKRKKDWDRLKALELVAKAYGMFDKDKDTTTPTDFEINLTGIDKVQDEESEE